MYAMFAQPAQEVGLQSAAGHLMAGSQHLCLSRLFGCLGIAKKGCAFHIRSALRMSALRSV